MGAEQPALGEGEHEVDRGQPERRVTPGPGEIDRLVAVAPGGEAVVAPPAVGRQLANPGGEPALADLAQLEAEPAQEAADAELHVQQLALQELAPDQPGPEAVGRRRRGGPGGARS